MTQCVFIRSGHGYESGDRGRCTAFDGFEIMAAPLPGQDKAGRDSRHFPRKDGSAGICYASHVVQLGKREGDSDLYILMAHGSGREVWRMPRFYDNRELESHILQMPERLQYALIYSLWNMASYSRTQARTETKQLWAEAFADGRIKKHRATKNRAAWVEILAKQPA